MGFSWTGALAFVAVGILSSALTITVIMGLLATWCDDEGDGE